MATQQEFSDQNEKSNLFTFLYEEAIRDHELTKNAREQLDSKIGIVLGFTLVAVVEILGFLLLVAAEKISSTRSINVSAYSSSLG